MESSLLRDSVYGEVWLNKNRKKVAAEYAILTDHLAFSGRRWKGIQLVKTFCFKTSYIRIKGETG